MRSAGLTFSVAAFCMIIGCQQETQPSVIDEAEPVPAAASVSRTEASLQDAAVDAKKPAEIGAGARDQLGESHKSSGDGQVDQHAGRGGGRGMGRGFGANGPMRGDMATIHAMFAGRDKITRTVKILPNGAEAVTESKDEELAALIQEHVPSVESRVLDNMPLPPMTFHPVFIELIKHSDDYTLTYEDTDKGMKVTYNAEDPYVVMLVQEHAKLVSRFLKNGMSEIHKEYQLPALMDDKQKLDSSD